MARISPSSYRSQKAARRVGAEVPAPAAYEHDAAGREAEEIFQAKRVRLLAELDERTREQREIAAEIRAAAKAMRECADEASSGPWAASRCEVGNRGVSSFGGLNQVADCGWNDARHIAGMHPHVAVAFAHLLDELAEFADHQGKSALVLDGLDAARTYVAGGQS
jgi:hypothetical protein